MNIVSKSIGSLSVTHKGKHLFDVYSFKIIFMLKNNNINIQVPFMKLIANGLNNEYFTNILPPNGSEIDEVVAAIAYGDDKTTLLDHCLKNKYSLKIWMRYDHTVPVAPSFLKKLLNSMKNGVFCHLVPDRLHAKVIWFKGHGAYIGSANLTDNAWYKNIEAGVFFTDEDLYSSGMLEQLEDFFSGLEGLEKAFPLTDDIYKEQLKLSAALSTKESKKQEIDNFNNRSQPYWDGLDFHESKASIDKRKEAFKKEWESAISYIQHIAKYVNDYRPSWVSPDTPEYWQVDQFLHAYYYNKVREGTSYPFEQMHQSYKGNPQTKLMDMLLWWQSQPTPPSSEDHTFEISAPLIRQYLSKEKIITLSTEQMGEVFASTHATRNHYSKLSPTILGKPDITNLNMEQRAPLFAEKMSKLRNKKGQSIQELLHYVLYGGKAELIWERIYQAAKNDEMRIDHYGLSSIAEVSGWAKPEHTPPRNGRTNKALRALGYPVKVSM